jgi:hypothetical protein
MIETRHARYRAENPDKVRAAIKRWQDRSKTDYRIWASMTVGRLRARKRLFAGLTADHLAEVFEDQEGKCALTGILLKRRVGRHDPLCASVDRIDNNHGYRNGNVRVIAWCVNSFRMSMTDDEMLDIAEILLRHNMRY